VTTLAHADRALFVAIAETAREIADRRELIANSADFADIVATYAHQLALASAVYESLVNVARMGGTFARCSPEFIGRVCGGDVDAAWTI
jgi:hypothetical protein